MPTSPGAQVEHAVSCPSSLPAGGAMSAGSGTALIQRVVRQAVEVFRSPGGPTFRDGLATLSHLVHQVTAHDVAFDPGWVRDHRVYEPNRGMCPMTYVRLYENDLVSIGIFILKSGFTMPMHDHPNMYGVLKVLHGSLRMRSYTRVPAAPDIIRRNGGVVAGDGAWETRQTRLGTIFHTKKEPLQRIDASSKPCVLTPELANVHQISADDGPVAFMDILAPPYDNDEHEYHNFKELDPERLRQLTGGQVASEGWLVRVKNTNFSSDEAPYRGPPLDDIR